MPRGRKHPHPGNPATIASSATKAATSGLSGRNSKSDVKRLQDPPSKFYFPNSNSLEPLMR
ncbi:hypothetical protein PGT21_021742 [Puccinia graminis f. sp. tritici]|uniref:Uncharacterized protein n=1 Tax=Puccinia graminis f. sp. tritici TaxID=56615 RepID=A0A5B0NV27_PUCGR|nr:hypothetical protein PGT21_021742 [Puccinia graminis f. sp. tritici]